MDNNIPYLMEYYFILTNYPQYNYQDLYYLLSFSLHSTKTLKKKTNTPPKKGWIKVLINRDQEGSKYQFSGKHISLDDMFYIAQVLTKETVKDLITTNKE